MERCTDLRIYARLLSEAISSLLLKYLTRAVRAWYVRPVITGKTTYSEIEVIKGENAAEEMKRYDRARRTGFGSALYRVKR